LVYRLQGDLLNATGDQAAAERSYRRALAVADRQNAKALELRATTNLACLWRDQGKRTEAHDLLSPRDMALGTMRDLPQTNVATDLEVLHFIHEEAIFGRGIGYVDAHLLASVRLTPGTSLWTRDKRLRDVANQLGFVMVD
jgi:predicted nucleic acid-binding protein